MIRMEWPKLMALVRHGQSRLNWILHEYRNGRDVDHSWYGIPGWKLRLTDLGCEQAIAVAPCIEQLAYDLRFEFDMGYCSPFVRTIETASLILPKVDPRFWRIFAQIRERDWGDWECVPTFEEYCSRSAELAKATSDDRMFWCPPSGETGNMAMSRARDMVGSVVRSSAEYPIFSCHGELIEFTLRMFNDWGTLHDYRENQERWGHLLDPVNCQVILLSRVNPEDRGDIAEYPRWVKSIVPWDLTHKNNRNWEVMERKRYGADDLRAIVDQFPVQY